MAAAPPAESRSGGRRPGADGGERRLERLPGVPPAGVRRPPPPPLQPRPAGDRTRPGTDDRRPAPRRSVPPPGRLRRFVLRYGWRAYAIPLLTIATLLALVDLARPGVEPASVGAPVASPPVASSPSEGAAGAVGPGTPTPTVAAVGEGAPTSTDAEVAAAGYVEQGTGAVTVVPGSSPVYGTGPLQRFAVEVEDGIGVDGEAFAAAVEQTLADPRGWGNGGQMSFQRVGVEEEAAGDYDFKVSLISPGSMETYCPGVGTEGYTSCRYGDRAVINLARWETAVPDYQGDVATYRLYVVNHEVGHALGNGHEHCAAAGELAPVMQQQTLGLEGCTKNPWPYPA